MVNPNYMIWLQATYIHMQNDCWRLGSILHNGWSYFYSMVSVGLFKIILCLGIACSFLSVCRYCVCTWRRAILNVGERTFPACLTIVFQVLLFSSSTISHHNKNMNSFLKEACGGGHSYLWLWCGCMLSVRWWNVASCSVVLGFVLTFLTISLSFTHFTKHLNYMHMANHASLRSYHSKLSSSSLTALTKHINVKEWRLEEGG